MNAGRRRLLLETKTFAELGLSSKVQAAIEAAGYTTPTPIQAAAIPDRRDRPRRSRHRADGHRQDRIVRFADDHPARDWPRPRADAALADPGADARARRPGGAELREIRRQSQAQPGAAHRRRVDGRPGQEARPRRRRSDRYARPAARPFPARPHHADGRRDPRHRRGRPHARHGLHPRHREDLQAAAAAPADAVLLGDDAARDHAPRQPVPQRSRAHRGRPARRRPPRRSPSASVTAPTAKTGPSARCCAS